MKKMNKIATLALILLFASPLALAKGDPERGSELSPECSDCHGVDGMGNEEYPKISGLDEDYLFEQLVAFKNGERPNTAEMMLWFLEELNEEDLADLAAYYASLKAE